MKKGFEIKNKNVACPAKLKRSGGFSTLEIMISFAVMAVVLTGVVLANFGAQYWTIASQTSNEALYKAKINLETLKSTAKQNFFNAVSSPSTPDNDTSCQSGGLCYNLENAITDISSCVKYAQVNVAWQVPRYPQMKTSLFTYLTNPSETVAQGGDCLLAWFSENWLNPNYIHQYSMTGTPTSLDTLNGTSYIGESTAPYFEATDSNGPISFNNGFTGSAPINAIDVARDESTGRTYAYAAASDPTELETIDITDPTNPAFVPGGSYSPLDPITNQPIFTDADSGWRIAYYGQKIYIVTKSTSPQLHIFDVSNPLSPQEIGTGTALTGAPKVYGIIVRDQQSSNSSCPNNLCRFIYLAEEGGTVEILNASPANNSVTSVATINLPNACGDARSLALLGNVLYVGGMGTSCNNLFALNIADPYTSVPILSSKIVGNNIVNIKATAPFLFLETTNSITPPDSGLDLDGGQAYLTNNNNSDLQIWNSDTTNMTKLSSVNISGGTNFQVIYSSN
ncbi:MAG: hypothetical protein V4439_04295 [Patescibacteria group bacterium]